MNSTVFIHEGDCLETMRCMADNSVDSIVTDPPYGLVFMGKAWDHGVPSAEIWREALRVLKPGGHLLAFAGTRTQHRMACNIEDAGFEIRDMIAWVYGSGFPKSLDVSKAIDKATGAERECTRAGEVKRDGYGDDWDTGSSSRPRFDTPATDAARQWQGWGTALKPALEPITVARKPLAKGCTVAANVLAHGTGALNVDAARVPTDDNLNGGAYAKEGGRTESQSLSAGTGMNVAGKTVGAEFVQPSGRWPANLIHDGGDEVLAGFPYTASGKAAVGGHKRSAENMEKGSSVYGGGRGIAGTSSTNEAGALYGDAGSAARFFYAAKASKKDRGEGNNHPTVKPTDLMRYLCRLVTPSGGMVLDPFMGSGSTGKAAVLEGFRFIGCELSAEYIAIAQTRIQHAWVQMHPDATPEPAQMDLLAPVDIDALA